VFLGALNITMRRGLSRSSDVAAGAAVVATVAFVLIASTALVLDPVRDVGELWPFLLVGAFVPGLSQLVGARAVQAAGASRAGILFGMAPLFSTTIAIVAFGEPLRWPLVAGTFLVVAGGVCLAFEGERPNDFRMHGAFLAVAVAFAFGLRDNAARLLTGDVSAGSLAQAAALMLGASIVLVANLLRSRSPAFRFQIAFAPFVASGIVTALGQATLFEALHRGRVTVIAPLVGTGVLWTVVFAALFLRRSERVGPRLAIVAILVVAGGTLVAATH
jgi:drug/metabolite transporter (DMT)-like permease